MNTFAKTELLLKTAINLSQNSVKHIAAECGIKANCLYKWKTTDVNLSPSKHDALLLSLTMVGCNSGNFIGLAFVESVAKVKTPDEVIDPKITKKSPPMARISIETHQ